MLKITQADLTAVEAALWGAAIGTVFAKYPLRQKLLYAHAILAAGKFTSSEWKGQYGLLIEEIIIQAAGLGRDARTSRDRTSSWFRRERVYYVIRSLRWKLHSGDGRGNSATVIVNEEIASLLRGVSLYGAKTCYDKALQAVEEAHSKAEKLEEILKALKRHKTYGPALEMMLRVKKNPADLYEISKLIREVLQEHMPELLEHEQTAAGSAALAPAP